MIKLSDFNYKVNGADARIVKLDTGTLGIYVYILGYCDNEDLDGDAKEIVFSTSASYIPVYINTDCNTISELKGKTFTKENSGMFNQYGCALPINSYELSIIDINETTITFNWTGKVDTVWMNTKNKPDFEQNIDFSIDYSIDYKIEDIDSNDIRNYM